MVLGEVTAGNKDPQVTSVGSWGSDPSGPFGKSLGERTGGVLPPAAICRSLESARPVGVWEAPPGQNRPRVAAGEHLSPGSPSGVRTGHRLWPLSQAPKLQSVATDFPLRRSRCVSRTCVLSAEGRTQLQPRSLLHLRCCLQSHEARTPILQSLRGRPPAVWWPGPSPAVLPAALVPAQRPGSPRSCRPSSLLVPGA